MLLPNAEHAIIEPAKLRDYLLSPVHPLGRFKAVFFASLGYVQDGWPQLERDIREQHLPYSAVPGDESPFGDKYEIHAVLQGPSGRIANLVTVWIILSDERVPRLVTAYPGTEQ